MLHYCANPCNQGAWSETLGGIFPANSVSFPEPFPAYVCRPHTGGVGNVLFLNVEEPQCAFLSVRTYGNVGSMIQGNTSAYSVLEISSVCNATWTFIPSSNRTPPEDMLLLRENFPAYPPVGICYDAKTFSTGIVLMEPSSYSCYLSIASELHRRNESFYVLTTGFRAGSDCIGWASMHPFETIGLVMAGGVVTALLVYIVLRIRHGGCPPCRGPRRGRPLPPDVYGR
jgi:hypothetical protein